MEEADKKNKKIKPEDKKKLAISIFMVVALVSISYWRAVNYEAPEVSFSVPVREGVDVPSLEDMMSLEKMGELMTEVTSGDSEGRLFKEEEKEKYVREEIKDGLTIDRPSSWTRVDEESIEAPGEKTEIIFLSYAREALHGATVMGLSIDAKEVSEVIDVLERISKERDGAEMEVLEKEEREDGYFLKIAYKGGAGINSLSKNKVFFVNENCYLFSVIAPEERFDEVRERARSVLSSIQIKN